MTPARRDRRDVFLVALAVGSLAAAYGSVLVRLARQWWQDENASHGLIVVPLAVYLVWQARDRWRAIAPAPAWTGLAIVALSLLVYAAGILGAELFLSRISLVGLLAGAAVFIWGWRHLRLILFPLTLLALCVPLPAIILNQITFPLQLVASRAGEAAISAAGVPVLREGNVLVLANTTLEVAEACSGIRSLVSLATLALIVAYYRGGSRLGRAALVAAAVPIAVAANAARVAGTGLAAHGWGPQAAEGFFHTFSGWLVFGLAVGLLVLWERVLAGIERKARWTARGEIACASVSLPSQSS